MLRKNRNDIEQLKSHQQHYQQIYTTANPQGKRILKHHIQKLEERIQTLSQNKS